MADTDGEGSVDCAGEGAPGTDGDSTGDVGSDRPGPRVHSEPPIGGHDPAVANAEVVARLDSLIAESHTQAGRLRAVLLAAVTVLAD